MLISLHKHIIGWSVSRSVIQRDLGQITMAAVGCGVVALACYNELFIYDISSSRPSLHARLPLPDPCFCFTWGGPAKDILVVGQRGALVSFRMRDGQLMQSQKVALPPGDITFAAFLNTSCICVIIDNMTLFAIELRTMAVLQTVPVSSVAIATHDRYYHPVSMQAFPSSDHA